MDPATVILTAVALVFVATAVWCARRLLDAAGVRARLAWAGRTLALLGGAFAIWMPAELYGELVMVAPVGSDDVLWLPRAIWFQLAWMPVTVVPALVALRATRAGGLLFLVSAGLGLLEELLQPFGVVFPDASHDVSAYLFTYGPGLLTASLLLLGRDGPAIRERLSGRYLTLGPVS